MSRIILLITLFIFGCASQKPIEPNQVVDFDVPEKWEVNISQNLDFDQKWWNIFNAIYRYHRQYTTRYIQRKV